MIKKLPTILHLIALCLLPVACTPQPPSSPSSAQPTPTPPGAIRTEEFIFENAPFPSCHASTIVEAKGGLVAAWFGGTDEGKGDVSIWLSRHDGKSWSAPVQVANGVDHEKRYPCWNPVLFQPAGGPLLLFYKVGPSPSKWWGMFMTSTDGGDLWSEPKRLPDGILGPIKNKPAQLPDSSLLAGSSTEHDGWRVHLERTTDLGKTWEKSEPPQGGATFSVIQPAMLVYPTGQVQILCRSRRLGKIIESWSNDNGTTWSEMKPTDLPNPNSGIDATVLRDGRAILIYNHTATGRSPLNIALSPDGKTWHGGATLESEPGEFSYPAIIQTIDGLVHVTYTWNRKRIKHVVVDPTKLP
jgi:predicted neuraminidase